MTLYWILINLVNAVVLYVPESSASAVEPAKASAPSGSSGKTASSDTKLTGKGSGPNPITNITFTSGKKNVRATVKLSRDVEDFQPRIMRSDTPENANSYVIVNEITTKVTRKKGNTYSFQLPNLDTGKTNRAYCIQFDDRGKVYSSEAFRFSDEENSYILYREYKSSKTGKATWWILGIAIAILALVVLLLLSRLLF